MFFVLSLINMKLICEDKRNYGFIRHIFPKLNKIMSNYYKRKYVCLYTLAWLIKMFLILYIFLDQDMDFNNVYAMLCIGNELLQIAYFVIQNFILNIKNKRNVFKGIFVKSFANKTIYYIFLTIQLTCWVFLIFHLYRTDKDSLVMIVFY